MNLDDVELHPFPVDRNTIVVFEMGLGFVETFSECGPTGEYEPQVKSATVLRRNLDGNLVESSITFDGLMEIYRKLVGRRLRIDFWCMMRELRNKA